VLAFLDSTNRFNLQGENPMKTNSLCCFAVVFILVLGGAAMANDFVDVGLPSSEALHSMSSWGPIEPAEHGGSYGGVTNCRAIWSDFDTPNPGSRNAFITLNFVEADEDLYFRHLEGIADDGFLVYADGNLVYTHTESSDVEQWIVSSCSPGLTGGPKVVEFVATGDAWDSWGTFGQVCFDHIWVGSEDPVASEETTWGGVKSLFR